MSPSNKKPINEFRSGKIRASVWREESNQNGRAIVRHSIRINKRYFDKTTSGWTDTEYLFPDLILVAGEAYRLISLKNTQGGGAGEKP
jgi:hypothetical protein